MPTSLKPTFSVIIPTYNRAKYVTTAIDSVLKQTYDDYQIIVVDDGSTDNTQQVLGLYHKQIMCLYQQNSGVSAARNAGIKLAKGHWIAFLDSDDEWFPEYLAYQIEQARRNNKVCIHITNSVQISIDGKSTNTFNDVGIVNKFGNSRNLVINRPLSFIINNHITNIQATIIRRHALMKAGLFDESLTIGEDLDIIARAALQGPLGISDNVLVKICRREETIENLTQQLFTQRIYSLESFGKVYTNLLLSQNLSFRETRTLARILSSNRRAVANLFLKKGEKNNARNIFKKAFYIYPSVRSLTKYFLSYLPSNMALSFVRKNLNIKP